MTHCIHTVAAQSLAIRDAKGYVPVDVLSAIILALINIHSPLPALSSSTQVPCVVARRAKRTRRRVHSGWMSIMARMVGIQFDGRLLEEDSNLVKEHPNWHNVSLQN